MEIIDLPVLRREHIFTVRTDGNRPFCKGQETVRIDELGQIVHSRVGLCRPCHLAAERLHLVDHLYKID